MASITSNYGLSKPLGSEAPDISVINDNMDTLDSELVVKTSNDIADATATKSTGWTTVLPVAVGEKVASVFEKFSTMAKNIRWIYKFLGTADISSIGDGTVTNALTTLNTAVGKKVNTADIVNNLTSTSTTQPLSANMGKTLNDALGTTANTYVSIADFTSAVETKNYTDNNYRFMYFELLADTSSPNRVHGTKIIPMSLVRARPTEMEFVFDAVRSTSTGTYAAGCIMKVSKTSVGIFAQFSNGWTFNAVRVYGIK